MEFCGSIKAYLRCTELTLRERVFNYADIISQAQWHSDSSAVCGSFHKAPKSEHNASCMVKGRSRPLYTPHDRQLVNLVLVYRSFNSRKKMVIFCKLKKSIMDRQKEMHESLKITNAAPFAFPSAWTDLVLK